MIYTGVPVNGIPEGGIPDLGLPGWMAEGPAKRGKGAFYTVDEQFLEQLRIEDMEILEMVKKIVRSGILQRGRK